MSRILFPTDRKKDLLVRIENWRALLASPEIQWRSGFSAMSAALSWEAAQGLPAEIDKLLGGAELLLAIPEHKVSLGDGGRESQCDVFALLRLPTGTCAMAVEAKVNETFGPTIGEWRVDESEKKVKRLATICNLLGLANPPAPNLRYQLFHRTAAAVLEARRFGMAEAAMVVQSFSKDQRWLADFAAFAGQFDHHEVQSGRALRHILPDGMPLTLGWAACARP